MAVLSLLCQCLGRQADSKLRHHLPEPQLARGALCPVGHHGGRDLISTTASLSGPSSNHRSSSCCQSCRFFATSLTIRPARSRRRSANGFRSTYERWTRGRASISRTLRESAALKNQMSQLHLAIVGHRTHVQAAAPVCVVNMQKSRSRISLASLRTAGALVLGMAHPPLSRVMCKTKPATAPELPRVGIEREVSSRVLPSHDWGVRTAVVQVLVWACRRS